MQILNLRGRSRQPLDQPLLSPCSCSVSSVLDYGLTWTMFDSQTFMSLKLLLIWSVKVEMVKQLGVSNHINQRLPTRRYGGFRPRGNIRKNEYQSNNSTRTRETRRGYTRWLHFRSFPLQCPKCKQGWSGRAKATGCVQIGGYGYGHGYGHG